MSEHIPNPEQHYEQELEERGLLHNTDLSLTFVKSFGRWVGLLTRSGFEELSDGAVVVSVVSGAKRTKGVDYIDLDTRGGQIAYGIPIEGEDAETLSRVYGDPTSKEE